MNPPPASGSNEPGLSGAQSASHHHDCYAVDASVAIRLFVKEVLDTQARALFDRLGDPAPVVLHVPDLLYVECANILWKYVRRFGYDPNVAEAHLADLAALDLVATPTSSLVSAAFPLAVAEGVTAYDACYLALAHAAGCPLVTADERLVRQLQPNYPNVCWLGDYRI
ncbi:MAG: type II toxin-antitoxin system VapC family toxin [Chloroflexi bacterium]|nr:type II toxin-antitoxin system VapC family toxin [Chloroflexota bacterium]